MDIDHKSLNTLDVILLIGQLEHMRTHAILALMNAPDDRILQLLMLASKCQGTRRKIQKKYFETEEWAWCMVKVAGEILQLLVEITNGDAEIAKDLKEIVDLAVSVTLDEDVSGCASCRQDFQQIDEV